MQLQRICLNLVEMLYGVVSNRQAEVSLADKQLDKENK